MEFDAGVVVMNSELKDLQPSELLDEFVVSNPKTFRMFTHL